MAFPTAVNDQITDAVTQANVNVLNDAPALALSNLYQATSQALANAAHNATTAQQQTNITSQAATTMGVATLYAIDTAATGVATTTIFAKQANTKAAKQNKMAGENAAQAPVTGETIIGHIHSKISSPAGKKEVKQALEQWNADRKAKRNEAVLTEAQKTIEQAISSALEMGVSKQSVSYVLHQVIHDRGMTMLYPFENDGKKLKTANIEAYYSAIIAAHRHETN